MRVAENFRAIGYARVHKDVSQLKLDEQIASLVVGDGAEIGEDIAPDDSEDANKRDKAQKPGFKPHVPASLDRLLSQILPFKVKSRASEVGKQVDYLFFEGARGLRDFSHVDVEAPDQESEAASKKTFEGPLHSKRLLQSVFDGNAADEYTRNQRNVFGQDGADAEEIEDESGFLDRASNKEPRHRLD